MDPTAIEAIRTAIASDTSPEDKLAAVIAALGAATTPNASESPPNAEGAPSSATAPPIEATPAAPSSMPILPVIAGVPPRLTIEQALDLVIAKLRASMADDSEAKKTATATTATVAAAPQGMRIVMVPTPSRPVASRPAPTRPAPRRPLPTLPPRAPTAPRTVPQRRSKP